MDIEDIKDLLNQWQKRANFKSLIHDATSEEYRNYDTWTKISVTILGIFTTFDIIFITQLPNQNSFSILNILGIISTIIITILSAFEIHIKYPDSAEHHHILAILYSQIKKEVTSFLMKKGNVTRQETLDFYNRIQERLYLIETMDKECSAKTELRIENEIKSNNLNIDFNSLLKSKKKIKYTNIQLDYLKTLSRQQLIDIIEKYCIKEGITLYERIENIGDKTIIYNYLVGDLNVSYSFILSSLSNDTVIEITDIPVILCIDDDPVHNKILKNYIKKFNIECITDSRIALEAISEKKYNLILIDYKIPNISGVELTRIIRDSNTENKNVPIIGMSAYQDSLIQKECLDSGMNDFISKPIIKNKILKIFQYI